jgi:hypothetical protein
MAANIEQTLDAVVTKLNAGIAAKITAINAEFADDYELDNPAQVTTHTVPELVDFPHVMVLPDDSEPELDQGIRMIVNHQVRVVSWVMDADQTALARKLLRYQRAVKEVLLDDRTIAGGGWSILWRRDEYGPVFQDRPAGHFIQGAMSMFRVKQQADF